MEVKKAEDNSQTEKLRLETLPFSYEKNIKFPASICRVEENRVIQKG